MSNKLFFVCFLICGITVPLKSIAISNLPELQNSQPNSGIKEGGETIEDAIEISTLPFFDTGYTCDNVDDYMEICPYVGCPIPDVVYSWTATFDGLILVDLCDSTFDTQVYMYNEDLDLIACNDDFYFSGYCGQFVSAMEDVVVSSGMTYFIVVDGNCECGEYQIKVEEIPQNGPCTISCPSGSQLEGEPPLQDNYDDLLNSGCNNLPVNFQAITASQFCGIAGWYLYDGNTRRDTDWLECIATENVVTWTLIAESTTNIFQLNIPDCDQVSVLQGMTAYSCTETTMVIDTTPGQIVYLWVGSENYSNPGDVEGNEYNYYFTIDGADVVVSSESISWDSVKSLYR